MNIFLICYLTCADDWSRRLIFVSLTAGIWLFSDSSKFWLTIGFAGLSWGVAKVLKIREGEVSPLITSPPRVATGWDLSRSKPVDKIVGFYLEKENMNNSRFKESNREQSVFWIDRCIARRMNIICLWSYGCMDNNTRLGVFFQWTMMLGWNNS